MPSLCTFLFVLVPFAAVPPHARLPKLTDQAEDPPDLSAPASPRPAGCKRQPTTSRNDRTCNKTTSTLRGHTACVIEFCDVFTFHKQMCSGAEGVQSGPQKALHRLLGGINNRLV